MRENKNVDLEFIKEFTSIKLSSILKEFNINTANFYHGKVSADKVKLVRNKLDKEIIKLYEKRVNSL